MDNTTEVTVKVTATGVLYANRAEFEAAQAQLEEEKDARMSTYALSSTLTNALLNVLNGTTIATNAYTTSGNVFIQAHTGAPGSSGTSNISVGSTTRPSATFGSASGGVISIGGTPSWTNGGTSETLTAVSVWSASTSGTYLGCLLLTSSQAWNTGNVYTLSSLAYTIPTAA